MTLNVLYIEDEFLIRMDSEEAAATLAGIAVVAAADGQEASDILRTQSIDAIVADVSFPGNKQFFDIVRADYPTLPLVLLTGSNAEDIQSIVGIKSVRVFTKSVNNLPSVIDLVLDRPQACTPLCRRLASNVLRP